MFRAPSKGRFACAGAPIARRLLAAGRVHAATRRSLDRSVAFRDVRLSVDRHFQRKPDAARDGSGPIAGLTLYNGVLY